METDIYHELPLTANMSTNADNEQMTTSNDNEVAEVSMPSDKSMLTSQSDSVELYHALCDRVSDFSKALDACLDYRKELDEKNNEVARLRELLNRAIGRDLEKEALAPAPEEPKTSAHTDKCLGNVTEPANPTCANTTHKFSHCDCKEPVIQDFRITELQKAISQAINSVSAENGSDTPDFILAEFLTECLMAWNKATRKRNDWHSPEEPTEPAPEWRVLGEDEVIQEGDEEEYTDAWGEKMWLKVVDCKRAGTNTRLRTRRPLPTTNCKQISSKLVDEPNEPKMSQMPLEKEIEFLKERNWDLDPIPSITTCLVYLRDEIQKLKEAK
jgi:hypothetical protein